MCNRELTFPLTDVVVEGSTSEHESPGSGARYFAAIDALCAYLVRQAGQRAATVLDEEAAARVHTVLQAYIDEGFK
jgi:hypothetical protein